MILYELPFFMTCRMIVELRRQEEERARYEQTKIAIAAYAKAAMEDGDKSGFVASLLKPERKDGERTAIPNSSMFDALPVNVTTSIVHKG